MINWNQLRYAYDLTPESLVIDCGGYEGEFATNIHKMYACDVEVYEPIPEFYNWCMTAHYNLPPLVIVKAGVGNSNRKEIFHLEDNKTGTFAVGSEVEVDIRDIKDVIGNRTVDLLKLNIEGMEYEVLERIIECNLQKQIKNIQVQFHTLKDSRKYVYSIIKKGDLVFDVGANVGEKSKLFKELGAHVVAFEPQEICYNYLDRLGIDIETCALAGKKGEAEMFVSDADTLSSMSSEFIKEVKKTRFANHSWDKVARVKTDTLDNMIDKYGIPKFIKIDVEGFEFDVLSGLTKDIPYISIEFTPELIHNTIKCLDRFPNATFKYSSREFGRFHQDSWINKDEMISFLGSIRDYKDEFGDIYIKNTTEEEEKNEDSEDRYIKIREKLLVTHKLTYDYPFIWQNFRLRDENVV